MVSSGIKESKVNTHRPFTLVFGGGGARGFAHAGVLHALEKLDYRPHAIVGVSMGAVIGATYALREDWYQAILTMDTQALPAPLRVTEKASIFTKAITSFRHVRAIKDLVFGWGMGSRSLEAGKTLLKELTAGRALEEGRIPVAISTTDLYSGQAYVLRSGSAADAVYASAALAGVLPPFPFKKHLLADGAYADIAPIEVARSFEHPIVIAVDPGQPLITSEIQNGYQAIMRATEVCHLKHADMRFSLSDLVLRPSFSRTIDTFDFGAKRLCIAAGMRAVREQKCELENVLMRQPVSQTKHNVNRVENSP